MTNGEVTGASRKVTGSNLEWVITVQPSGNADVTVTLPPTTDCMAEGAICTANGRMLSGQVELTIPMQNSAATGAPTVSGKAQVGETLTASTSSIADSDGLTGTTFAYQWLADDTDISGATGSTYTLAASDQGKAIKVRVSFTDDRGHQESLTSAAMSAVAASAPPGDDDDEEQQATPLTATAHGVPSSHDGSAAFTFELHFSPEPSISYKTPAGRRLHSDGRRGNQCKP